MKTITIQSANVREIIVRPGTQAIVSYNLVDNQGNDCGSRSVVYEYTELPAAIQTALSTFSTKVTSVIEAKEGL